MADMGNPLGRTGAGEDVGDLEVGAHRISWAVPFAPGPPSGEDPVEWGRHCLDRPGRDLGVHRGGVNLGVEIESKLCLRPGLID